MKLGTRLIPVLLLRNGGLVKSTQFKNYKYVGDPINAVRIFNDKEVDEICLLDIEASKIKRPPDFDLIKSIANEAFVPFAYGGGITTLDQAKKIFKLGAEKVILNNSVLNSPLLLTEISNYVGRQSVVLSIDIKINLFGSYSLYSHVTGKTASIPYMEYLSKAVKSGAGEVLVNVVNKDGMMNGMETKLVSQISKEIDVPVILCGGAASLEDVSVAVQHGASAVAAGSMFVFHGKHKAVLISYPSRSDIKSKVG
jgi:cyclase